MLVVRLYTGGRLFAHGSWHEGRLFGGRCKVAREANALDNRCGLLLAHGAEHLFGRRDLLGGAGKLSRGFGRFLYDIALVQPIVCVCQRIVICEGLFALYFFRLRKMLDGVLVVFGCEQTERQVTVCLLIIGIQFHRFFQNRNQGGIFFSGLVKNRRVLVIKPRGGRAQLSRSG